MRLVHRSVAAAVVGAALVTGSVAVGAEAAPAHAAPPSRLVQARTDWIKGAHVALAEDQTYWRAARRQLSFYGTRFEEQRQELEAISELPETGLTPAQVKESVSVTRSLNVFFHTPGLYGVKPAVSHRAKAKADWVKSNQVSAAEQGRYLEAAAKELSHYGTKYATVRKQLEELDAIPLTSTTKKQRADAVRLVKALNHFFGTHYQA